MEYPLLLLCHSCHRSDTSRLKHINLEYNIPKMTRIIVVYLMLIDIALSTKNPHGTVILNMVVRDEIESLHDCLSSISNLIDGWVIMDAGTTDGTRDLIKEELGHLPGVLHETRWINATHNRQEALGASLSYIQENNLTNPYILIIDANEGLIYDAGWKYPPLTHDAYRISTERGRTSSMTSRHFIKATPDWYWDGIIRESLYSSNIKSIGDFEGVRIITTSRQRISPEEGERFERLLLENLQDSHGWFHLAQGYHENLQYEKAIVAYRKRIEMGGWSQEVYASYLGIAEILESINTSDAKVEAAYREAIAFRPQRLESYYYLARRWRLQNRYEDCWQLTSSVSSYPMTTDTLLVAKFVYQYGILLEQSVCAYWSDHERYFDAYKISGVLRGRVLPSNIRKLVDDNLHFIRGKIHQLQ